MVTSPRRLEGVNWAIERGLVEPYVAEAAAQEILDAIAIRDPMVEFDHEQPAIGLVGYIVDWEGMTPKQVDSQSLRFPALLKVKSAIAEVRKDSPSTGKQDIYDAGYVNITRPGGRVHVHTDSEPLSLVFASLRGQSMAKIRHVSEPNYTEGVLTPGDALRIDNPMPMRQRPKHVIYNLSDGVRVSYGEYYSQ